MLEKEIKKVEEIAKETAEATAREIKETAKAAQILAKLVRRKHPTPEEIKFLKSQSVDIAKAVALIGLQAVPGSSLGIIALEKIGQKHGFTLFPKAQEDQDKER